MASKTECFLIHDGVRFFKIKSGLIEIRYLNITFNEKIIQNDICFILSLFQAIQDKKFSLDILNYQISEDYFYQKNVENPRMFLSFLDLIVDYPYMDDLKGQYQKILSFKRCL